MEELLATVRGGGSSSLLVRGEPGIGKSALLERLIVMASGFQVVRAVGVQGEVDLPYAGLHQLSKSMLDDISILPPPQADALRVALGLTSGEANNPFLVGLAVLTLMSEVARTQPLLCVVDDAQWLDLPTTQSLAFVARRLGADSVGLVIASRTSVQHFDGLLELEVNGLAPTDARALLDSVIMGRLDDGVRERFLAETRGNPLALMELPHTLSPADAAAGIIQQHGDVLSDRIEASFQQRLEPLPEETRQLLLLAAAEPLGDHLLLLRAASHLNLRIESAEAAEEAGLIEIRERVAFRHPLVRSAVYRSATRSERRRVHAALAEATDATLEPDRRAWHRAQATSTPDEEIAAELERTAARAKARGGLTAAGAFLERAAMLTPEIHTRADRALAAAELLLEAGAFESVENLLRVIETQQMHDLQAARVERLHAIVTLEQSEDEQERTEAVLRLLTAAKRLMQLDAALGLASRQQALEHGFWLGPDAVSAVAEAIEDAPAPDQSSPRELMVHGRARLYSDGYPAGTDLLRSAMIAFRDSEHLEESDLPFVWDTAGIALSLWDFDSLATVCRRTVQLARDVGAFLTLPKALASWASCKVVAGDFSAAATLFAEADAIGDATQRGYDYHRGLFDAFAYEYEEALARLDEGEARDPRSAWTVAHARAVVHNAAGQYELALEHAQRSSDSHPLGVRGTALIEIIEAATRCGEHERAKTALEPLLDRTQRGGTDWAHGLQARCVALVSDDAAAEPLYQEAIECLARARTRPDLARAHLVYGEWLRRSGRRIDAREQLRIAHDLFGEIGMPVFSERARRELAATGATARKRTDDRRADLTAQESLIARLAADGYTNPEIGAQLFLSPRTVQYHLRKVYPKLGISSRRQLRTVARSI